MVTTKDGGSLALNPPQLVFTTIKEKLGTGGHKHLEPSYVETDNPLTAHMHRRRLAAFRQMGYELVKEDPNGVFKWD